MDEKDHFKSVFQIVDTPGLPGVSISKKPIISNEFEVFVGYMLYSMGNKIMESQCFTSMFFSRDDQRN